MADGLTTTTTLATIPDATTIATDDAGAAGHVQIVKLALGTDGSATPIGADANGLDVDITRFPNGPLTVSGSVTAAITGPVTVTGSVTSAITGPVTVTGSVGIAGPVTVTGNVTNAGTFAVQATVVGGSVAVNGPVTVTGTVAATQATASNFNAQVVGNIADGTAASGNPVTNGVVARATNRAAVADGAVVRMAADDMGRVLTQAHQPRDLIGHTHTQISNSTVETTVVPQTASTFKDLISLVVTNQTAAAVNVTIKDAAAGTTRMVLALTSNGGAVLAPSGIIPQASAGNAWTATLSNNSVTVNVFAHYANNV